MEQDDRKWVQDRWGQMGQRMKLGLIEKCQEVTKEVWNRRDAHADEKQAQRGTRNNSLSSVSSTLKREFSAISEELDMEDPFAWPESTNKRRAVVGPTSFDTPRPVTIKSERSEGRRQSDAGTELLEPEFTVRGRLHWLGVMKDWNWEGEINDSLSQISTNSPSPAWMNHFLRKQFSHVLCLDALPASDASGHFRRTSFYFSLPHYTATYSSLWLFSYLRILPFITISHGVLPFIFGMAVFNSWVLASTT